MTIKELIFQNFNNVKYIAITGSESLLETSRGNDIDVLVFIDGHPKEREKFRFELDGNIVDVFVRDYNHYLQAINFEEPHPMHSWLVFYPFANEIYNDNIEKPNFVDKGDRLYDIIRSELFHKGCDPEAKIHCIVAKTFNKAYLAKVLIEGRTSLSQSDMDTLLKIYNKDRKTIEELVSYYGRSLSPNITRIL